MPTQFINANANVGITDTFVYAAPADTSAIIHTLVVSNSDLMDICHWVTIKVKLASNGTFITLGQQFPIPTNSTFNFKEPINLRPLDELHVVADVNGFMQCFCSILELFPASTNYSPVGP
jgi:hypothetical protein